MSAAPSENGSRPKTALERQRKSRERTDNTYPRARNAAEREVIKWTQHQRPAQFEVLRAQVDKDFPHVGRVNRQARVRSLVAAWYREAFPAKWSETLDRHIAERVAAARENGVEVEIHRRTAV